MSHLSSARNRLSSISDLACRLLILPIRARCSGIVRLTPEYWIRQAGLTHDSVVADCGVGDNPHFSLALIERYGVGACHLFDPTSRHHAGLEEQTARSSGKLKLHKFAISETAGTRTLHETLDNVSGSLLCDHCNVLHDRIVKYQVPAVTLDGVFAKTGAQRLDVVKLDIEGEEYPVLNTTSADLLTRISQLVVEFHHHCVERYSPADTLAVVSRMRSFGFSVFSCDSVNYLFYRS